MTTYACLRLSAIILSAISACAAGSLSLPFLEAVAIFEDVSCIENSGRRAEGVDAEEESERGGR